MLISPLQNETCDLTITSLKRYQNSAVVNKKMICWSTAKQSTTPRQRPLGWGRDLWEMLWHWTRVCHKLVMYLHSEINSCMVCSCTLLSISFKDWFCQHTSLIVAISGALCISWGSCRGDTEPCSNCTNRDYCASSVLPHSAHKSRHVTWGEAMTCEDLLSAGKFIRKARMFFQGMHVSSRVRTVSRLHLLALVTVHICKYI